VTPSRPALWGVLLGVLAAGAILAGCRRESPPPTVTIGGHTWRVEIAKTEAKQRLGLSGRTHLADDEGMLFVYDGPAERRFWMQHVPIPLDIAFISADLRIIRIHTMAVETDLTGRTHYPSLGDAQYALEIAGGSFARLGVREGDRVMFSAGIAR